MAGPWDKRWTGGCQCGAIRFASAAPPTRTCVCHCRMCQKASGQPFQAFATFEASGFRWTRGEPSMFASSSFVNRGFCNRCGTPLSYQPDNGEISISIGALDDPASAPPTRQFGAENELSWCAWVHRLPRVRTEDDMGEETAASLVNYQHPDHDT